MMSNEEIAQKFAEQNCAQMILARYAQHLGANEAQLIKIGFGLLGGMQEGSVCGAYLAAVLVLGLAYGDDKEKYNANLARFKEIYFKTQKSSICKEVLGYDLSRPDELEAIVQKGLFAKICPCAISDSMRALDQILEFKES
ncbi:C-GCAxxG-C-C family protein [Campylobacter concisus]|uniref:C-GCAxxG-C-C family protein n=1 Tax=Campylobacter concisus TaxID=199 RepID=UPI0011E8294C|nr:C-GCAxxG-C-C family protein [Campylobacter concisus]